MPQQRKKPKLPKKVSDVSLYPLDPETAIRAILEAGPHPVKHETANRRATVTLKQKERPASKGRVHKGKTRH